ncbi:ABC transporter ATP-binding protein [Thalassoroseus pseudoceratinae]|uniref:ABC transporter ATP-binding protein n=1 Tax=Thalassoroseus pseudoceratinae TaxID=2713176 RepID=UPI00141E7CE5|nr:ATP-binding cassette domain-containing protein [Thalassoroseus pseudoceratinae]
MTFILRNVGFSYSDSDSERKVEVLRGLSTEFAAGERIAIRGPSGVGKSTLISILGLLTGTSDFTGSVSFTGTDSNGQQITFDYRSNSVDTQAELRRTTFGFALQSGYLMPHLSVVENIAVPLGLNGVPKTERRERVEEILERQPDLRKKCDSLPGQLSGGQRQRVSVLRALIHRPMVVFADEPFSQLDAENREAILDTLVEWQAGELPGQSGDGERTLFLVCHNDQVALERCTCWYRLGAEFLFVEERPETP